ncbi:hypothetical protein GHT89_16410 [Acinetobacter baumannii]|uniref:S26 family signal peptidase n=1 Tax=Acinetobacter baumannii TaxID=470 RepID=UPI00387DCECD
MKKIALYGLITLAGLSSLSVLARQNFVINITDSLPPGLYSLSSSKTLMRDNLIVFCPNLNDQTVQYLRVSDPATRFLRRCEQKVISFTKPIGAVEGDTVKVTDKSIFINGQHSVDFLPNKKLPHVAPGTYTVKPGTVWVISKYNPLSFDSRYFGAISVDQIIGNAKPLWVSHKKEFCYAVSNDYKCIN